MIFNTETPFLKYAKQYSNITISQIFKYGKTYFKFIKSKHNFLLSEEKECLPIIQSWSIEKHTILLIPVWGGAINKQKPNK